MRKLALAVLVLVATPVGASWGQTTTTSTTSSTTTTTAVTTTTTTLPMCIPGVVPPPPEPTLIGVNCQLPGIECWGVSNPPSHCPPPGPIQPGDEIATIVTTHPTDSPPAAQPVPRRLALTG